MAAASYRTWHVESHAALLQWTEGARDNLKFLATLERHFEVLETGSLTAVADAMAPLMAALRMVWIISRHYGDDERMGALFSRIATKLADRIEAAVQTQACPASPGPCWSRVEG